MRVVKLSTVLLFLAIGLEAASLSAVTLVQSPAKAIRTVRGGILDEIAIYVEMPPADAPVAIRLFSATDTDLGTGGNDGKEARQTEAKTVQEQGPKWLADRFVEALKEVGPYKNVSVLEAGAKPPAGALIVEDKFTTIDPGSRAKRYLVGFGSGKSQLAVSGSITSADGAQLATFSQKRVGVMGIGGGDSLNKLTSDSRSIGEDIAKFLSAWAGGKKLK